MKNIVLAIALFLPFITWAQTHSEIVAPTGIELNESKNGIILKLRDENWNDTQHHFKVNASISMKGEEVISCEEKGGECALTLDEELFMEMLYDDLAMNSGKMSEAKIVFTIEGEDSILLTIQPHKYFPKNLEVLVYNDKDKIVLSIMDRSGLVVKELTNAETTQAIAVYDNLEDIELKTKNVEKEGLVAIVAYEDGHYDFFLYQNKAMRIIRYETKGKKLKEEKNEIIMDSLPDDLNFSIAKSKLYNP